MEKKIIGVNGVLTKHGLQLALKQVQAGGELHSNRYVKGLDLDGRSIIEVRVDYIEYNNRIVYWEQIN